MTKEAPKTGFEDFARLQQEFWNDWLHAAQRGANADFQGAPWSKAAEAWSEWMSKPDHQVSASLFEILAEQGQSFLSLCENAGKAGVEGDAAWLDHWLETLERGNEGLSAFAWPADGVTDLMSRGVEQTRRLLDIPALGYSRERQAEYQSFLRAQLEWQQANARYASLLGPLSADTARRLRDRLAAMEESPGEGVNSLRGLFNLWVDAAEDAFAELAFSAEFRAVYGQLINATMRYRKAATALLEPQLKLAGIPTSAELEQTTRQLHALRREVAKLKSTQAAAARPPSRASAKKPRKKAAAKRVAKKAQRS